MEDLEKKKKELEEDIKKAKGDPDSKKAPVRLKDSVLDRKFDFPWALAKKWSDTLKLLEQAYEAFPELHRRVLENRFELVGPDRQIILPSVWETTVQPGWEITLLMPPDPHQQMDPLMEQMMMMDLHGGGGGKKKHKSSGKHKDGKSSSKDKDRRKKRGPDLVDAPMVPMPGPYPGGMGMPNGALFGTGPLPPPPMDGLVDMDPAGGRLEKDERGRKKREKERGKKSGQSGGFLGFGKR
ncbi:hypothetical protein BDZ85DRAFT_202293 [Elsinoe ampelina]|uniref:Ubiquitin-like domain-containing protein n=1 Tax=Elsinoe ampelina TaxID=302913 RepID=A0A6A6G7Q2_9PEZI|nr:hypothetical protein BDZ85DRAFT_202293 [Elsinoe ampelina]